MTAFKDYEKYDGLGLAELVKKKEVFPGELLEASIERIEKRNPQLGAVVLKMFDQARQSVQKIDLQGPFAGVPFLLKDLLAAYAGVPMTGGSRAFKNYIPPVDSELVRRFKKTGAVILGKTNTPEFGLMAVTEPELHGATRNPWDPYSRILLRHLRPQTQPWTNPGGTVLRRDLAGSRRGTYPEPQRARQRGDA